MVSERRRRRRLGRQRRVVPRRVALAAVATAVVVGLAVGIAGQVHRQSLPYERTIDLGFATLVGPLGVESAATGRQMAATLSDTSGADRVTLLAALQAEAGAAARTAAAATATTPPGPDAPAGADCVRALQERSAAAATVQSAVNALLGGPTGSAAAGTATTQMQRAGVSVQQSDADWARCRASLRRAPGLARVPASSWGDGGQGITTVALTSAASSLTSDPGLAAAPGLTVEAVTTAPAAVGVSGTPPRYTVPATSLLTVHVLVGDTGNVSLPAVTVTVTVTPGGGGPGASARKTLSLAGGGSAAVTVSGLPIVPGSSDTVSATASAAGGAVVSPAASLAVAVAQAASATAVTPSANPIRAGGTVTYTAVVTGSLQGAGALTGPVAFEDAGNPIPGCTSRPLTAGVATCTVRYPTGGVHSVTAVYDGTATIGGSTSPAITETVQAPSGSSGRSPAGSSPSPGPATSSGARGPARSGGSSQG